MSSGHLRRVYEQHRVRAVSSWYVQCDFCSQFKHMWGMPSRDVVEQICSQCPVRLSEVRYGDVLQRIGCHSGIYLYRVRGGIWVQ